MKTMSPLLILQSLQFILFCIRKMILYQIVVHMSKRLCLWGSCTLHWRVKHGDLRRFWFWYYVHPVLSPLRLTVKGRGCASALHCFKEITYRTDEWTKQLLGLKSWVISGSPEQWMEFHHLWWTVIVFNCSYLFHSFYFFCLLVQNLLVFPKLYLFCSISLMTLSEQ